MLLRELSFVSNVQREKFKRDLYERRKVRKKILKIFVTIPTPYWYCYRLITRTLMERKKRIMNDDYSGDEKFHGRTATKENEEEFLSLMPIEDGINERTNGAENDIHVSASHGKRSFDKFKSLPPWMESCVDHRCINPLVAFHNEIVAFCRLMEPREEEMKTRKELVASFTTLAELTFRDCKVEVFGSQATG